MRSRWSRGDGGLLAVVTHRETDRSYRGRVCALVYHAGGRLRRVEFSAAGRRRAWERRLSLSPRPGAFGRLGALAVLERSEGGLDAYAIDTGELHWHVEHPSELAGPLLQRPDGTLLLVFADDRWSIVDPASGKWLDRGATAGAGFARIAAGAEPLGGVPQARHQAGRCRLTEDGSAVVAGAARYRPEGWSLGRVLVRAGERLVVGLEKQGQGGREGAAAVLRASDLGLVDVIELGCVGDDCEIDGVAAVDDAALLRLGHTTAVFDGQGHLAAWLPVDQRACVFGDDDDIVWRGKL